MATVTTDLLKEVTLESIADDRKRFNHSANSVDSLIKNLRDRIANLERQLEESQEEKDQLQKAAEEMGVQTDESQKKVTNQIGMSKDLEQRNNALSMKIATLEEQLKSAVQRETQFREEKRGRTRDQGWLQDRTRKLESEFKEKNRMVEEVRKNNLQLQEEEKKLRVENKRLHDLNERDIEDFDKRSKELERSYGEKIRALEDQHTRAIENLETEKAGYERKTKERINNLKTELEKTKRDETARHKEQLDQITSAKDEDLQRLRVDLDQARLEVETVRERAKEAKIEAQSKASAGEAIVTRLEFQIQQLKIANEQAQDELQVKHGRSIARLEEERIRLNQAKQELTDRLRVSENEIQRLKASKQKAAEEFKKALGETENEDKQSRQKLESAYKNTAQALELRITAAETLALEEAQKVERVRAELKGSEQEYDQQRSAIENRDQQIAQIAKERDQQQLVLTTVRESLERSQEEISNLQGATASNEERMLRLEGERSRAIAQLDTEKENSRQAEIQIQKIKANFERERESADTRHKERVEQLRSVNEQAQRISQEELERAQSELADLKQRRSEIKNQYKDKVKALETEKTQLKSNIEDLERQSAKEIERAQQALEDQRATLERELRKAQSVVEELRGESRQLESRLQISERQVHQLQESVQQAQVNVEQELEKARSLHDEKMHALKDAHTQAIEGLKTEKEDDAQKIETRIKKLQAEFSKEREQEAIRHRNQIDRMTSAKDEDLKRLRVDLEQARLEAEAVRERAKEAAHETQSKGRTLESEIVNLKSHIEKLKTANEKEQEHLQATYKQSIAGLEEDRVKLDREKQQLKEDLRASQDEIQRIKSSRCKDQASFEQELTQAAKGNEQAMQELRSAHQATVQAFEERVAKVKVEHENELEQNSRSYRAQLAEFGAQFGSIESKDQPRYLSTEETDWRNGEETLHRPTEETNRDSFGFAINNRHSIERHSETVIAGGGSLPTQHSLEIVDSSRTRHNSTDSSDSGISTASNMTRRGSRLISGTLPQDPRAGKKGLRRSNSLLATRSRSNSLTDSGISTRRSSLNESPLYSRRTSVEENVGSQPDHEYPENIPTVKSLSVFLSNRDNILTALGTASGVMLAGEGALEIAMRAAKLQAFSPSRKLAIIFRERAGISAAFSIALGLALMVGLFVMAYKTSKKSKRLDLGGESLGQGRLSSISTFLSDNERIITAVGTAVGVVFAIIGVAQIAKKATELQLFSPSEKLNFIFHKPAGIFALFSIILSIIFMISLFVVAYSMSKESKKIEFALHFVGEVAPQSKETFDNTPLNSVVNP